MSSGVSPRSRATSTIGRGFTLLAISMSDGTRQRHDGSSLLVAGTRARSTKRQPNRPLMQRLPAVMALSSGDVALTISPSCTCSVSVQPTPQYGQIVSVVVWRDSSHAPRGAQVVLAARHQRAGRADGDAVAAVDARRVRQRDGELGRDARVEAAAGDRDRERVLVIRSARLDALVAEHALAVVADVEVVVDLRRLRDRGARRRRPNRSGRQPYSVEQIASMPGAVDRSTDDASSSSTSLRACIDARRSRVHDHAGLDGARAARHEHARALDLDDAQAADVDGLQRLEEAERRNRRCRSSRRPRGSSCPRAR